MVQEDAPGIIAWLPLMRHSRVGTRRIMLRSCALIVKLYNLMLMINRHPRGLLFRAARARESGEGWPADGQVHNQQRV